MNFKNIIYTILLALFFTACTKDFSEINTNPNAPTEVQPSLLLRNVLFDYGEQMSYEGYVAGNLLGQLFTAIDFNLFDRHSLTEPQFGGNPWDILYTNLRNNEIILDKARTEPTAAVYEGPALVLKAYMAAALTDLYGDVPYFEALNGKEGNVTPVYDAQEQIYTAENGILDNLDQAIAAMESYTGLIALEGDIFYNGDLDKWIQFANSLKIKSLLRISARQEVSGNLQKLVDEANYIAENSDNAIYDFTDGQPNNFRMANLRAGDFGLFVMSETMQEILEGLNDPRRAVFFRPTAGDAMVFNGVLNGPDASATSISTDSLSFPGLIFRENTGKLDANYMTAWETNFLLAEAAEKGLINADANAFYDLAVTQAFEYWLTELPADYLTTGNAAYGENGNDPLAQIITQKWLANTVNGYEGWIEWRRTGFPTFKTIAASLNADLIPVRLPYPTDEAALNSQNFTTAASATDGNSVNVPVWWDF